MLNKPDYQLRFYTNSVGSIPTEEIVDLLQKFLMKKLSRIKPDQRRALIGGVKFLDLALRGRKIIKKTLDEGIVSGDLIAVRAYNIANSAYRNDPGKAENIEEVLKTAHIILSKLLEWSGSTELDLSKKSVEITGNFFNSLEEVSEHNRIKAELLLV
jgi:hypothetical protein